MSTSSVDRHGEIVDVETLDVSKFMQNPVVLFGHDYWAFPVGKALTVTKEDGGKTLVGEFQLAVDDSEEAATLYKLWAGGFINAMSIGFIPKDIVEEHQEGDEHSTTIYKNAELIEVSIVPVPANSEALRRAVGKGIVQAKSVKDLLLKGADETDVAAIDTNDDDEKVDVETKSEAAQTDAPAGEKEMKFLDSLEGTVKALRMLAEKIERGVLAADSKATGEQGASAARIKRVRLVSVHRTAKLTQPVLEAVIRGTKATPPRRRKRIKLVAPTKKG